MELERARRFASAQRGIRSGIINYKPGETGHEALTPRERFEGLWGRLDELATRASDYDGLDRSEIRLRDTGDLLLIISRRVDSVENSSVRRPRTENIRTITARFVGPEGNLHTESLNDQAINTYNRAEELLGLLEESERAAVEIIEEQEAQRLASSNARHYSDGHP